MQQVTIGSEEAGQRLDKFLRKYLPNAGSSFLYKMLRKKNITLNDKKADGHEILMKDDRINMFFSDETFAKFHMSEESSSAIKQYLDAYKTIQGVEILKEDDNILIVNKPSGVLTQKATDTDISLNEWLIGYLLQTGSTNVQKLSLFRPSVCNRLDRNTSGIVLCGKTLPGSQMLSEMVRERTISKFYRTICAGVLKDELVLNGSLKKDTARNKVTVLEDESGSAIRTRITPLKSNRFYTYVRVELITGKTHQIRAHLASVGHPLIGDYKYGDRKVNDIIRKKYGLTHQLLHAEQVVFPNGETIKAPLPEVFTRILHDNDLNET